MIKILAEILSIFSYQVEQYIAQLGFKLRNVFMAMILLFIGFGFSLIGIFFFVYFLFQWLNLYMTPMQTSLVLFLICVLIACIFIKLSKCKIKGCNKNNNQ